jgi:GntR family transcriptional regulator, transcriptional repressor for pyruvate dehydrogenase complex
MKTGELIAQEIVAEMKFRRIRGARTLEPEHELTRNLQAGRASLRQALRLLESFGVIQVRCGPAGGPVISTLTPDSLAPLLRTFLSLSGATFRDIQSFVTGAETLGPPPGTHNPIYELLLGSLRLIGANRDSWRCRGTYNVTARL